LAENPHHRDVPLRPDHVKRRDRAVVHPELGVAHHLRDEAPCPRLLAACLGQFDVHVECERVAEQVRKDRIDGFSGELFDAQEVMAELGDPVRRMHEEHVRLQAIEALPRVLIRPSERLPAALRLGLVLRRVLAVDEMRWMGGKIARKDFTLCHDRLSHSAARTGIPERGARIRHYARLGP